MKRKFLPNKKLLRRFPTLLMIPLFTVASLVVTIVMICVQHSRVWWAALTTLLFFVSNALLNVRIRARIRTLRNYRATRRAVRRSAKHKR